MGDIRIGISGWSYPEWRGGPFYPEGLAQSGELEYAARFVNSIEINATFYKLQTPASFRKWTAATPADLVFAVKGSKYITHQKKLQNVAIPLANFFASGILELGHKLGPILWQLPPWYRFDRERIEGFLNELPTTTREAARFASKNTINKADNVSLKARTSMPLRYAFEPRHESFFSPEFIELLREYNVSLVFSDAAGQAPLVEDLTADCVYIRLHGSTELYASDYNDQQLADWARKIKSWQKGRDPSGAKRIIKKKFRPGKARDVFAYFDNSINAHAPYDAISLARLVGVKAKGKL
jgi:uncharacterized protein YecE (DUF72 family)